MARIFEHLTVLGGQRIAAGDVAGIDVEGLSLNCLFGFDRIPDLQPYFLRDS